MKKELEQYEDYDDNIFDLPKYLLPNEENANSNNSLKSE